VDEIDDPSDGAPLISGSPVIVDPKPVPRPNSENQELADSICDQLLHNAHRIVLKGPSKRKEIKEENNGK